MFRTFPDGRERPYFFKEDRFPRANRIQGSATLKGSFFLLSRRVTAFSRKSVPGPPPLPPSFFLWDVRTGGGNRTCFSANKHFFPQMSEREKAIRIVFSAEQPFFPRNIRTGGRKYGLFSVNKCFSGGGNTVCPFRK